MKLRMHLFLIALFLVTALLPSGGMGVLPVIHSQPSQVFEKPSILPETPSKAILIELFTSQGCSSCPPADDLLRSLVREQPVAGTHLIALSQHVDYWNGFGWRDPFSSAELSRRQENYQSVFESRPYTPQMVVDGVIEFNGSSKRDAITAIIRARKEPKAAIRLEQSSAAGHPKEAAFTVSIEDLPGPPDREEMLDVYAAITESGLNTRVTAGENSGRALGHSCVARRLKKIGKINRSDISFFAQPTLSLKKEWVREALEVVVFVQERKSLRIVGATSQKLAGQEAQGERMSAPPRRTIQEYSGLATALVRSHL